MKAINESAPRQAGRAGLILLFDGEVGSAKAEPDEHSQTGILTPGLNLAPAFPPHAFASRQWLVGVCNPIQWRNRPRFSRGSQTLDCGAIGIDSNR